MRRAVGVHSISVGGSAAFGTRDRCGISVEIEVWYLRTMEVPSMGDDTDLKEPQATARQEGATDYIIIYFTGPLCTALLLTGVWAILMNTI